MIFKSPIFAQASGSIAGTVFSHNQGGMYVRSRATPTNPNSEAQQAVRDGLREAVYQWQTLLSNNQRENWNTYAFNTPTFNRLGEATHKTGQQMFVRGTVARLQAGLSIPVIAPTDFNLGSFTPPTTIVADDSAQTISFEFNEADVWALTPEAALLVYMGRPQNPTRIYGKGPYQLASMVLGDSPTAPTSPHTFTTLFPFDLGQRIFLKFNLTMPDGRYSVDSKYSTIVVA